MAQGSAQANILPEKASIITNSRLLPGETLEDLEAHFKAVLPEYVHFRLLKGHNPPAVSTTDSPAYRLLERLAKDMHGEDVHVMPALVFGGTDSRYYSCLTPTKSVYRFTGLMSDANTGGAHAVNEHINTEIMVNNVKFYVELFKNYGK
jgi:carboxypeptidase PM20D1